MDIVAYKESYQQQVIQLIVGIQQEEFQVPITLEDQPDLLSIPAVYQVRGGNFWLALNDNHVIGTIALIDLGEGCGTIRKMFVAPSYRGKKGVAKELLASLLKWAPQQGIVDLYLGTTDRFKGAHRFYEKNDFYSITKKQLPANFPLVEVDTFFYWRNLKNLSDSPQERLY